MTITRPPAHAGTFYPAHPEALLETIDQIRSQIMTEVSHANVCPRALIVPHAGYMYSGYTAAVAYQTIVPFASQIRQVVVMGPAHRVAVEGIVYPKVKQFQMPLGNVHVDEAAVQLVATMPKTFVSDEAHREEHAIEVQLPFLQSILPDFSLVPLVVGQVDAESVHTVISHFWHEPETLIVISADLSHYLDYATCCARDAQTAQAIESYAFEQLTGEDTCGVYAIQGLLSYARANQVRIERLHLCNSGDLTDDHSRVVGYGAWALYASSL